MSDNFETQKKQLSAYMLDIGIKRAVVTFAGGGDSGQVEEVAFWSTTEEEAAQRAAALSSAPNYEERVKVMGAVDVSDESTLRFFSSDTGEIEVMTVAKAAEHLAYSALNATGMDWYNNDGGQGEITIDATTEVVTVEMGINITTTEDYSFEY